VSARARLAAASLLALAAGCARGEPLRLAACDCGSPDGAKLNQPIVLRFSGVVDPGSVRATTIRVVRERDGAPVPGRFAIDGAVVTFLPHVPCLPDLSDVAFQRGEGYRVEVPALPVLACVRALDGDLLDGGGATSFRVTDAPLDAPTERLFFDPDPGVAARQELATTLVVDRARIRLSKPIDPRSLADAVFWFRGPWTLDSRKELDPKFRASLVENDVEAVIELVLATPPPVPLEPKEKRDPKEKKYEVECDNGKFRDLSGALVFATTQTTRSTIVRLTFVPMDAQDKKDHP
jgi:hypothetical protein